MFTNVISSSFGSVSIENEEKKRSMQLDIQLLLADFGKRKGHLLSLLAFILHIK
jgi:hypothetical protein